MASLVRLGMIQALKNNLVRSIPKNPTVSLAPCLVRLINTSSKPPQASSTTSTSLTETTSATEEKTKHWTSWGFFDDDEWMDRALTHTTFFCGISIGLVFGIFTLAYLPDDKLIEWGQREAYLQLRYREDHGLPPIDRNLIDPSVVILPTDEELGDTEIII